MTKLNQTVLNRRVFKQPTYEALIANGTLGSTLPLLDKYKITLDVGGAAGMYSAFFALHSKSVFGFEAVPEVFKQLKKVEQMRENFAAVNRAVSNENGTDTFYVDDKRLSNSSFQDLVDGIPIEVEVIKLDTYTSSFKDQIGFIKIDTEGTELRVLEGATNIIETSRPSFMIEIYPKFNDGPVDNTFKFLIDRDYDVFYHKVRQPGLHKIDNLQQCIEIAHDPDMIKLHDGDFIFVAKERNYE